MHASGTYFCSSSDNSFVVVPFHPAYLLSAGCMAIVFVNSPSELGFVFIGYQEDAETVEQMTALVCVFCIV